MPHEREEKRSKRACSFRRWLLAPLRDDLTDIKEALCRIEGRENGGGGAVDFSPVLSEIKKLEGIMATVREELEAVRVQVDTATTELATRVQAIANQIANGTLEPGEATAAFAPVVSRLNAIGHSPAPAPVIPTEPLPPLE